ncbi:hypothetical protein NUW58_g3556 [Xylaria curta]|uniref:Uncharacterized protein n=1 Tax=Xylaria curta TaxID=42375 RepID=A0ACC1PC39_9PEZI|nr:hypothetical protein NUW58_g3556 [Xylaria curta]
MQCHVLYRTLKQTDLQTPHYTVSRKPITWDLGKVRSVMRDDRWVSQRAWLATRHRLGTGHAGKNNFGTRGRPVIPDGKRDRFGASGGVHFAAISELEGGGGSGMLVIWGAEKYV